MKLVTAVALIIAIFCGSTLAIAEGPVPFKTLMRGGAQPGLPPIAGDDAQSASSSSQPAPKTHMTATGKVMTGVGIGLIAVGGLVMAATPHAWATSSEKDGLYAGSGATMGVGVVLIVFGVHRRSAR